MDENIEGTIKHWSVENKCKCSLDRDTNPRRGNEQNTGYCEWIHGHEKFKSAVRAYTKVLSLSDCHTMDRESLRA